MMALISLALDVPPVVLTPLSVRPQLTRRSEIINARVQYSNLLEREREQGYVPAHTWRRTRRAGAEHAWFSFDVLRRCDCDRAAQTTQSSGQNVHDDCARLPWGEQFSGKRIVTAASYHIGITVLLPTMYYFGIWMCDSEHVQPVAAAIRESRKIKCSRFGSREGAKARSGILLGGCLGVVFYFRVP